MSGAPADFDAAAARAAARTRSRESARESAATGLRAARAILAVRRGPRAARTTCDVACPWCGAARFEPCTGLASGRSLAAMHPSRLEAWQRRDDHLDQHPDLNPPHTTDPTRPEQP